MGWNLYSSNLNLLVIAVCTRAAVHSRAAGLRLSTEYAFMRAHVSLALQSKMAPAA